MEFLGIALAAVVVVSLAVWWLGRKKPLVDDELPWESRASRDKRKWALPSEHTPAEEVIADELRPAVRKLRSDVPMVSAEGATELGRSNHPDAPGFLIGALGSEQRSIRFAVFEALVALRAHSVGPLRAASAASDANVRSLAGLILGQIERIEQGAAPVPLADLLSLSDKEVGEMSRAFDLS